MEWLQQHDPLAKDFGYLLRYMPVRTYILLRDLERMPEIWETDPMFADFVKLAKTFPDDNERPALEVSEDGKCRFDSEAFTYQDIKDEVCIFFQEAIKGIKKHFIPQWIKSMVHFSIAGEKETAKAFSK